MGIPLGSNSNFRNLRALVVDDCNVSRRLLTVILSALEVEFREAASGREAVDLFLAGEAFDLVVMDNEMPVMAGPEATRAIRSMAGGGAVKIVGVSINPGEDAKREYLEAGIDAFVMKPMTMEKVRAVLSELYEGLRN